MDIAIVDDLPMDRLQLSKDIACYAREHATSIHITEYESGEAFLQLARPDLLDAVFLDIYLKELTGMDVARKICAQNPSCQIIFVTSSAAFAVQSYDVRAFYYIVKPYRFSQLANVLQLLDKNVQKSLRYITVKEGREWTKVLLSSLLYVDYSNHYVQLHTENAIVSTYMKFSQMEEMLSAYHEFLTCYRCITLNMDKVKKVEDLFFLLCNGEYIPINRKHVKEIKARYMDYLFGLREEDGSAKENTPNELHDSFGQAARKEE